jgi:hypothetical protein
MSTTTTKEVFRKSPISCEIIKKVVLNEGDPEEGFLLFKDKFDDEKYYVFYYSSGEGAYCPYVGSEIFCGPSCAHWDLIGKDCIRPDRVLIRAYHPVAQRYLITTAVPAGDRELKLAGIKS